MMLRHMVRGHLRVALAFFTEVLRTFVYIDGFNLYYGCLKGTKFRWLDLDKLCRLLLPKNNILAIKYFTARIKPRPGEVDQPIRQQTYIRALGTFPHISVIYGHFLSHKVMMPLANPVGGTAKCVQVVKTDEKGSDVNLATHLLNDAHKNEYDCAVVISNDSDLSEPIRIVRQELSKVVGLINPQKRPSKKLQSLVSFMKQIRPGVLSASQLPDKLKDAIGEISKPTAWR